ncbi:transcription initiation factor TFIID subunit 12-like [Magallana gigas]|uniref:transcription initiation factor TFIID subunit 12-like n=1 Tax=Magallana gigas TaxID=29159 RepID=UPI00333E7FCF
MPIFLSIPGDIRCITVNFKPHDLPSTTATTTPTVITKPPSTTSTVKNTPQSKSTPAKNKPPITTINGKRISTLTTTEAKGIPPITTTEAKAILPITATEAKGIPPITTTEAKGIPPITTNDSITLLTFSTNPYNTLKHGLPQTTHTFIAGSNRTKNTDTGTSETSHCDVTKVKKKATKGRVECYCIHPDSGVVTKVIALNPRVSLEKLLIAAGLGAGAMITTLGVVAFLFTLTKRCRSSHKSKPWKENKTSIPSLTGKED